MEQRKLSPGPLLNHMGGLAEPGYATSLIKQYDRSSIKGGRLRIKEWDYYLVHNERFALALTIADNAYMGLISASFIDFERAAEKTVSPMFLLPLGKTGFPASSASGDVQKRVKNAAISFTHETGGRRLKAEFPSFDGGLPLLADVLLFDEPEESMVIATPFREKFTAFYYNQKIVGMRAEGSVTYCGETYTFSPEDSFGLLDWGRGVWTYENTWYWGAGAGMVDGHKLGFNIGYGFGNTAAASENMLFLDGKAHKLSHVTFHIPTDERGRDDYLSPWAFSSDDGRFEATFVPILDRASCTQVGPILSDQHQVFGRMYGAVKFDDGSVHRLDGLTAMAEKVHNKW